MVGLKEGVRQLNSTRKGNDPVKLWQFYGALLAMLSLFLLLFLVGEATPDKNVIDVTFDEEVQLTTSTFAQEIFQREEKKRTTLLCMLMVGLGAGCAVECFLRAEKIKERQRAASEDTDEKPESVPKPNVDEKARRKKEAELRRLYDAGLLDRKEYNARWNALQEEDEP